MDLSTTALRVLREVAERGTFTAAARSLGYTQSAVSRQVASLESGVGAPLFERRRTGVTLTVAGRRLLPYAIKALDALDAAELDLRSRAAPTTGRVRLGAFPSAGPTLVVPALAALRRDHPALLVTTRDGATPALVRALRSGAIDLAVLASVPPFRGFDDLRPALRVDVLTEGDLRIAVPVNHPFDAVVDIADLAGQQWISGRSGGGETALGVWPGLAERQQVVHTTQDWLTKLSLVAAGCGITSTPALLHGALPAGVRLVSVRGGPRERRRLVLASLPTNRNPDRAQVEAALREVLVPTDDRG